MSVNIGRLIALRQRAPWRDRAPKVLATLSHGMGGDYRDTTRDKEVFNRASLPAHGLHTLPYPTAPFHPFMTKATLL